MSSHGKSSYSGKTQSSGVSWYNHVSHKFMIPYGIKKRDDYFEEKELLGIMKPNTCELLCRPSIGMSEFGEALEMCPPLIKSLHRQIDLNDVIDHLEEVKQLSEMFNNRGNFPQAPTESDLKRLIRFMIEPNDRMEDMLTRTEEMAMYLYTTINNIRQLQVLMMNPQEFASTSQHEQGKDEDFKRNPTLEEEEQRKRVSKSQGKSARKTSRTGYTTDHQSERTKTVQLLHTSSPENQAAVTTNKTSRTRHTTKRHTRPKRISKTDVSYSEQEAGEMDRQQRSKGAKRKTRISVPV